MVVGRRDDDAAAARSPTPRCRSASGSVRHGRPPVRGAGADARRRRRHRMAPAAASATSARRSIVRRPADRLRRRRPTRCSTARSGFNDARAPRRVQTSHHRRGRADDPQHGSSRRMTRTIVRARRQHRGRRPTTARCEETTSRPCGSQQARSRRRSCSTRSPARRWRTCCSLIGLALLIFEFFTAGVGIAGVVGAVCIVLACYGLGALPARRWAVGLLLLSMLAFAIDVQVGIPRLLDRCRHRVLDHRRVVPVRTGARQRRCDLVDHADRRHRRRDADVHRRHAVDGPHPLRHADDRSRVDDRRVGVASSAVDPDGVVEVGDGPVAGAHQPGDADQAGDALRVVAIDGVTLEVEPLEGAAKDYRERRPKSSTPDRVDPLTVGRRGPAMRRSSRRRVTPRASSSASSGSANLRLAPVRSRNWATVNPSGDSASSSAATRPAVVDRCAVEAATPSRSTRRPRPDQLARSSPGRHRRRLAGVNPPARSDREERVVGERIDRCRPDAPGPRRSPRPSSVAEHRPFAIVERRQVEAGRPGCLDASCAMLASVDASTSGVDDPVGRPSARRRSPVSSSSSSTSTQPRSAITRSTVRSGAGLRRRQHGRDVEHLAAADGLVATRLAQHVAIAGQQRQRDGQEQPHEHRGRRAPSASAPSTRTLDRAARRSRRRRGRHRAARPRGRAAASTCERRVEAVGRPPPPGDDDRVAAAQVVVVDARRG